MSDFIDKWHTVRERQGSNIVAGLDPALPAVGQGEKGLPDGVDLLEWSLQFIDSVAPYVAAVKTNQAFFQGVGQRKILQQIVEKIHSHDLIAMSDNKIADIGNTNNAWAFYNQQLGYDAMTCAPYAGNIEGTIASAHEQGIAMVTMGLMSNPEYREEMNYVSPETGKALWQSRVERSLNAGADGIVVGGTYTKEDSAFMEFIELTNDSPMLYLIPGIGAQGGGVETFLASGIKPEKCMINSSRGIMFPNGSRSAPEEQASAAKTLRDSFNNAIK